jgi:branched-chain amino acid aminotransferase
VEEVGTMNIFFRINGVLVTPSLEGGSILGGITRDSVITLCRSMGYNVVERLISIDEVFVAHKEGILDDVFGTGTAAVISPVGELSWNDQIIKINEGKMTEFSKTIYNKLTGIQYGSEEDKFNWVKKIC